VDQQGPAGRTAQKADSNDPPPIQIVNVQTKRIVEEGEDQQQGEGRVAHKTNAQEQPIEDKLPARPETLMYLFFTCNVLLL
jgi:hypothetical protein